ncbi:hypothetical protein Bbelb_194500 [Branchiostoma belcheri]|nr:hypothetical protein Bbelb_194500 [Branchiostoma belcheri]
MTEQTPSDATATVITNEISEECVTNTGQGPNSKRTCTKIREPNPMYVQSATIPYPQNDTNPNPMYPQNNIETDSIPGPNSNRTCTIKSDCNDGNPCMQPSAVKHLQDDGPTSRPTDNDDTPCLQPCAVKHLQSSGPSNRPTDSDGTSCIQSHSTIQQQNDESTYRPTDDDDTSSTQPYAVRYQQNDDPACRPTEDEGHIHTQPYAVKYQEDDQEAATDPKRTNCIDIQPYAVGYQDDADICQNDTNSEHAKRQNPSANVNEGNSSNTPGHTNTDAETVDDDAEDGPNPMNVPDVRQACGCIWRRAEPTAGIICTSSPAACHSSERMTTTDLMSVPTAQCVLPTCCHSGIMSTILDDKPGSFLEFVHGYVLKVTR